MRSWYDHAVTHAQALVAIRDTLEAAPGPVSIAVVDDHGEVVACLAMDGAARDTLENARRKAYTAARSDATSTRALAEEGSGARRRSFLARGGVLSLPRRGGRVLRRPGVGAQSASADCRGRRTSRLAVAAIAAAGLESPHLRRLSHSLTLNVREMTGRPGLEGLSRTRAVTQPASRPR